MVRLTRSEWAILIGLATLSLVPCIGGVLRLVELTFALEIMPENPRVRTAPLPVVIHLIASIPYCLLGILQFLPNVRRRYPRWHQLSGRMLVLAGLVAAISGLWMTHFFELPEKLQGPLLYWVRVSVSLGMLVSLILGMLAILRKRVPSHKAWMLRAYALGQGAGTQVVVVIPWHLIIGEPSALTRDLLMTFAWIVNLYVAQIAIWGSWRQGENS